MFITLVIFVLRFSSEYRGWWAPEPGGVTGVDYFTEVLTEIYNNSHHFAAIYLQLEARVINCLHVVSERTACVDLPVLSVEQAASRQAALPRSDVTRLFVLDGCL